MDKAIRELDLINYERVVKEEMEEKKVSKMFAFVCLGGVAFGSFLVL